jgi:fructose/tagatose bisphosphate aldolase
MMNDLPHELAFLKNSLEITGSSVLISDIPEFRKNIVKLVENSVLGSGKAQGWSRFLVRTAALQLGNLPASVHDLYLARGRGEAPMTWTTPAFNLRALSFEAARAMFRAAKKIDAGAFIFEIARSEIGYTGQRPSEYATNILAAAIAEQFQGPVFLQGDHFQVSAKRYTSDPQTEIKAVKDLTDEAIKAGFFNIDIDTSTLVDIDKPTVPEQQTLNFQLSAMFGAYIRAVEPNGVVTSIGGEIGEVGGYNSTAEELRVFMDGYNEELSKQAPGKPGLSKISIQTGTSHGGTVLADGTIAKVNLDFATLKDLSIIARNEYGLGGTVQHGASTLPEENFNQFVLHEAIEVHLATNFMNMFYDNIPTDLRAEMYSWLDSNHGGERKPDQSDEQFYYKTRKNAVGAFKAQAYGLPEAVKAKLGAAWEDQFSKLFDLLGVAGTSEQVAKYVNPVVIQPKLEDYVVGDTAEEDVSDLAD